MFHGDRVPGHVDAFDWSKRSKGLSDGVLPQLVVDGADIDATHDGESSLTLSRHLKITDTDTQRQRNNRHTHTDRSLRIKPPHQLHIGQEELNLPTAVETERLPVPSSETPSETETQRKILHVQRVCR